MSLWSVERAKFVQRGGKTVRLRVRKSSITGPLSHHDVLDVHKVHAMIEGMNTPAHERPAVGFAEARKSLKTILDTSDRGGLTIIRRGSSSASVVNADKLLEYLIRHTPANVHVVNEDGAWAMFIPGTPLASEGATLAEATADLIDALRDYAEDWEDHLQAAPNHAANWALVQIIDASTDEQVAEWLTGSKH